MVGNRPIKKFKSGNIESAIWLNEREKDDGSLIGFKTVSLTRHWRKNDEDVWRSDVINFRRNDLQKAILVLQKTQEELLLNQEEKSEMGEE